MTPRLTIERLKELLSYNKETGLFTWIGRTSHRVNIGDIAGSMNNGYVEISIDGERIKAHRLAWFYVYGAWPTGEIDHRDGGRINNRIDNLRDVSHTINIQNQRRAKSNNKLGVLGVSRNKKGFRATIKTKDKQVCIGTFPSTEEAGRAYLDAKRSLHQGNTL